MYFYLVFRDMQLLNGYRAKYMVQKKYGAQFRTDLQLRAYRLKEGSGKLVDITQDIREGK